jgi:hypothetical protein
MAEWIPHPSLDSLRAGGGEFDALHPFFGFCDFLTNWSKNHPLVKKPPLSNWLI